MEVLAVQGGKRLEGEVRVHGAKNSVLPILAASILVNGKSTIHNCPDLSDVDAAIKILTHLGCSVRRYGGSVVIDSSGMYRSDIPDELMREMRSSVVFLGAILARTGSAVLSLPGGCELGPRPIDLHLAALRDMGADICQVGGSIVCTAPALKGCRIDLSIPSVGATENAMLAACMARGTTVINNAAAEPEIWGLQQYLRAAGARVNGAGSSTVVVEGMTPIKDFEHSVIPDRIEAATFLAAVTAAGGEARILDVCPEHLKAVTDCLAEMGSELRFGDNEIHISRFGRLRPPRPIETRPHPGFPTDAQPPIMAAALKAEGSTMFVENIFQNRYRHVGELIKMGADIKTEGRSALVWGVAKLHGASVSSTDLRGGAALVVAALSAEGETTIGGLEHIDRGYENMERSMNELGAKVRRLYMEESLQVKNLTGAMESYYTVMRV